MLGAMSEEARPPQAEQWRPAGFWIRFGADLIDSLVIYAPAGFVAGLVAGDGPLSVSIQTVGGIVLGCVYYTVLTARTGQTWGKKVFDLKVVRLDGSPVTGLDSFLRWCAYLASYLTLCIGFLMAGWSADKRALHDYIAGTRVIRKGAEPAASGWSPWKIAAAVAGVGVVLLVAAGFAGVAWLNANKDTLKAEGDAIKVEAKAFGEKTDQAGCLTEAFARGKGAGFMAQVRNRLFLDDCLDAAAPTEGFCAGAPADSEIFASVAWRLEACEKLGRSGEKDCSELLGVVQDHCGKKTAP